MAIILDPARSQTIYHRVGRAASFKIIFSEGENPRDISAIDFELFLKKEYAKSSSNKILHLTIGDGLEIGGADNDELTVTISEEDAAYLEPTNYHWQLVNLTSGQTWLNGPFIAHNGNFDAESLSDVDVQIDLGDVVIDVAVNLVEGADLDIDGGSASSSYLADQVINGGNA